MHELINTGDELCIHAVINFEIVFFMVLTKQFHLHSYLYIKEWTVMYVTHTHMSILMYSFFIRITLQI